MHFDRELPLLPLLFATLTRRCWCAVWPHPRYLCSSFFDKSWTEVELVVEGRVLLRFASAYGFRNIQTLTRKLKTPKVSDKG
eukprot:COSAG02_NODE_187_length_30377_cov_3.636271_8_plen_82_part_00